MATSNLSPEQIEWFSGATAQYISAQRARYKPQAEALTAAQQLAMAGFFNHHILNTRLVALTNERVSNPDFYAELQGLGFQNLPDQSSMAAITFVDVVVSHVALDSRILFHELVHAEQYRQLGIPHFSRLYVTGFLNSGGYYGIPLEKHAYELDARYNTNPQHIFSVEQSVRERIGRNGY